MDNCSFFVKNRAMFGSYPSQETVGILENIGVKYFVNLTFKEETGINNYNTSYNKVWYPFVDRSVPIDSKSFCVLVYKLYNIITKLKDNKIYIHCRGGHGRSGILVACISSLLFNLSGIECIGYSTYCHSKRKQMRQKWRDLGSPQTFLQKEFVKSVCGYMNVPKELLLDSDYEVMINGIVYKNALQAFHSLRTEGNKHNLMNKIIIVRFKQHIKLTQSMLKTYLKRFYCIPIEEEVDYIFINCINNIKYSLYF